LKVEQDSPDDSNLLRMAESFSIDEITLLESIKQRWEDLL